MDATVSPIHASGKKCGATRDFLECAADSVLGIGEIALNGLPIDHLFGRHSLCKVLITSQPPASRADSADLCARIGAPEWEFLWRGCE